MATIALSVAIHFADIGRAARHEQGLRGIIPLLDRNFLFLQSYAAWVVYPEGLMAGQSEAETVQNNATKM